MEPIVNQPSLYINGMICSNDATTPNTILDVSAGICRDSANNQDILLGNYLGVNGSSGANAATKINFAVNGLNGLDTGSIAASTLYYIYVIADPTGFKASGCIASTTAPASGPLMPLGYSLYRLIGYWPSDGSSHLLLGYMSSLGNNALSNWRQFTYDAPQATAVTAGHATSYTAVDLTKWVPLIDQTPVWIAYSFTPNAATTSILTLQGANSTGNAVSITGQVASVPITGNARVLAQIKSSKPEINYAGVSASDATALNVAGFEFIV